MSRLISFLVGICAVVGGLVTANLATSWVWWLFSTTVVLGQLWLGIIIAVVGAAISGWSMVAAWQKSKELNSKMAAKLQARRLEALEKARAKEREAGVLDTRPGNAEVGLA